MEAVGLSVGTRGSPIEGSRERGMQPRHAWIKARRTIAKVAMKVAMAGVGPKPGERRGGRQKGSETVLICLKYL